VVALDVIIVVLGAGCDEATEIAVDCVVLKISEPDVCDVKVDRFAALEDVAVLNGAELGWVRELNGTDLVVVFCITLGVALINLLVVNLSLAGITAI